jgi:hypothetical protein
LQGVGRQKKKKKRDKRDDEVNGRLESRDDDMLDSVDSSVGRSDDLIQDGEGSLTQERRRL